MDKITEPFFRLASELCSFSEEEKELIGQTVIYKALKQNDFFVKGGSRADYMGYLLSGSMRKYFITEDGIETTSDFSIRNSFVSSFHSFYGRSPSFEWVQALTDCELLLFSYTGLQELYARSHNM